MRRWSLGLAWAAALTVGLTWSATAWAKGVDNSLPFTTGQVWSGQYVCNQGLTQMRLHITGIDGLRVRAIWEFHHVPSGIRGRFGMSGTYQPEARRLALRPEQWIDQPPGWVFCGLAGTVSADGRQYTGNVTSCSANCTWFRVALSAGLP